MAKQNAMLTMVMRWVWGLRWSSHFMAKWAMMPTHDGGGEEQHGVHQHLAQTCAGAGAGAQHAGQHHDADDIINDGGTDDGGAEKALQVAQLLQGRHRDGHAGGGHDGADEEGPVELRAAHAEKP